MHRLLSAFAVLVATCVTAQDNFNTYLQNTPTLRETVDAARNVTILVPWNENFQELVSTNIDPSQPPANSSLIDGILTYHVINGTYRSSDITSEPKFLKTLLDNPTFENVRSGQVIKAINENDTTTFYSGLLKPSKAITKVSGIVFRR